MEFSEISYQLQEWLDQAKDYFEHLSAEEQYGWVAESAGIVFFLTGVIMLIF